MRFVFTSKRVDEGHRGGGPSGGLGSCTTEAQVNQALAGRDINHDVATLTEAQLRGVHQYIRAIALGTDTSSVETAISAII